MKTEPVVLNHLLEESIGSFYTVLKASNITPYITMPDEKIIRCLDSAALARVFSNLLNNAVKYSEGNLYITLTKTGEPYYKTHRNPGMYFLFVFPLENRNSSPYFCSLYDSLLNNFSILLRKIRKILNPIPCRSQKMDFSFLQSDQFCRKVLF